MFGPFAKWLLDHIMTDRDTQMQAVAMHNDTSSSCDPDYPYWPYYGRSMPLFPDCRVRFACPFGRSGEALPCSQNDVFITLLPSCTGSLSPVGSDENIVGS